MPARSKAPDRLSADALVGVGYGVGIAAARAMLKGDRAALERHLREAEAVAEAFDGEGRLHAAAALRELFHRARVDLAHPSDIIDADVVVDIPVDTVPAGRSVSRLPPGH